MCECCGEPIRLMCQDRFCCGRCEEKKCDHPQRTFTDGNPERHLHLEMRKQPWPRYPADGRTGLPGPFDGPPKGPPKGGARF